MNRSLQLFEALRRRPQYAAFSLVISVLLSITFLYFDYFLFFQPEVIFYLPLNGLWLLFLNLALASSSGLVIALSIYQLRNVPRAKGSQTKVGLIGILAALFAGACPCYYLIPVLAVSAGSGGALITLAAVLNNYEIQIKLGSLVVLAFTAFTLERSFRALCRIP